MLRRPFKNQYRLSQSFGANPDSYAGFGLKGHNGLDYALPKGTELLAPIDGKITEVGNDATGYGGYVKIENDTEGHLLGHMSQIDVTVGQEVYEGQHLGLSGGVKGEWGAGNTTGAHLHWGRFPKPRNRDNGYSGYEDQAPLLISWSEQLALPDGQTHVNKVQNGTVAVDAVQFPIIINKSGKWDGTVRDIIKTDRKPEEVSLDELKTLINNLTNDRDSAQNRLKEIKREVVDGQTVGYYITELANRTEQVGRLKDEFDLLQVAYNDIKQNTAQSEADKTIIEGLKVEVKELATKIGDLNHDIATRDLALEVAVGKIKTLETELAEAQKQTKLTVYDAVEQIITKIITALKGITLK